MGNKITINLVSNNIFLNSLKRLIETAGDTSTLVALFKNLCVRYSFAKLCLDKIYNESQTHRLIKALCEGTKINFRCSFFGKITEIKEEENNMLLNESKVVICLINLYKKFKLKVISYFGTSRTSGLSGELIKELYCSPIKNLSIITIVGILINIIFSILLKKEIGLLGWSIRVFFLFLGLSGLSSNATWEDIKKTSYFIKQQNKKNTKR